MGEWSDLCESAGIPNDENALDHFLAIWCPDDQPPRRRDIPAAELSEIDRKPEVLKEVLVALAGRGVPRADMVVQLQYCYRIYFEGGSGIDVYFTRNGRPSSFNFLNGSEAIHEGVRVALQMDMERPAPAERYCWSTSRERELRLLLDSYGWQGLLVDHFPFVTTLVMRRTRFKTNTFRYTPGCRWARLVLRHDVGADSTERLVADGHEDASALLKSSLVSVGLV